MIHCEKHLFKALSVKFYCFLKEYVNYFDFDTRRGRLTDHLRHPASRAAKGLARARSVDIQIKLHPEIQT